MKLVETQRIKIIIKQIRDFAKNLNDYVDDCEKLLLVDNKNEGE